MPDNLSSARAIRLRGVVKSGRSMSASSRAMTQKICMCVWPAQDIEVTWHDDILRYKFKTAWSPPRAVIVKASKMFVMLKFSITYFDGAAGFMGLFVVKGGKTLREWDGAYKGNRCG
jgi:hypothetical protein